MYESELIEKIVRDTLSRLPPMPSRIKRLAALDSRIELVNCLTDIDSNDVLKIENSRIFVTLDTTFSIDPDYLPSSLVFDWNGYPSKSFSPHFHPKRNVDFKSLDNSLMRENPFQKFEELTFINLSQCQSITNIPNMFGAIKLRTLILDRCNHLEEFDESIGFMPKLVYLSASECNMIKRFVPKMYMPSLEVLSLNLCRSFECLPEIVLKMEKPLKISMINTAIKEFPKSINNLVGLEYIDVSMCSRLDDISSCFLLPKLITLQIDGCLKLGGSFKRSKESESKTNDSPNLVTLYASDTNLSYADLYIIFEKFSNLEHLDVSHNNFASLPSCDAGCLHLKSLNVSYCRNLKEISKLPIGIQKLDARYCPSLTSKTSSILWSKVYEEKERIHIVMPKIEMSNTFVYDHVSNEGIPLFWARWKFPVIAIAFMFGEAKENDDQIHMDNTILDESDKSHIVGLHLFVDGKEIIRKDFHYCSVGEHHVLFCDLRTLFSKQEWQGLDEYLGVGWKAIQVQFESCLTLSSWGVYVYKQKTNKHDIKFQPPNSNCTMLPPSSLVPERTPQMSIQRIRHALENMSPSEIFGKFLAISELDDTPGFTKALLRSWKRQKHDFGEELALAYGCGTCLKLELEDKESVWDVVRVVELMKGNVPTHGADSYRADDKQSACIFMELFFRERVEFLKKIGYGEFDIDMPIVLEACHFGEGMSRRYWGKLKITRGDPNYKAVWRKVSRRAWGSWIEKEVLKDDMINIVLLKCQSTYTEEASTSTFGVKEELLRRIEEDTMRSSQSYGKMKASIVLCEGDELISDKYLMETLFLRAQENWEQGNSELGHLEMRLCGLQMWNTNQVSALGRRLRKDANFKTTPYGKLRVEGNNANGQFPYNEHRCSTTQNEMHDELEVEHDAHSSTRKKKRLFRIRTMLGGFGRQSRRKEVKVQSGLSDP